MPFRSARALLIAGLLATGLAAGQTPPPTTATSSGTDLSNPSETTGYHLPPEKYRRAIAYSRARYRLHFVAFGWGVLVLLGLLAVGVPARLRDLAERFSRSRFAQACVFVPLLLVAVGVLEVPPEAWRHHLARVYDQSVQGWPSWLWDQVKGLLLGILVAVPIVWLLYALLRRYPRRWWLLFWLASIPILVFVLFAAPLVVDPLFFRFEPLAPRSPELAARIEEVTVRAGITVPRDRMFVMDASSKLQSVNAYVTGLGASKRVVVWDTTLRRMAVPQTLFVFGHELGHYVLRHVPRTIAFLVALLLPVFYLAARGSERALTRYGPRWGIRSLSDWASLPVLLLAGSILAELALPAVNGYSRRQEHDADVFGLEAIRGVVPDANRVAADAFQVLGEINLADPEPPAFIRLWLYSHKPIGERVRFALSYDPATPKYLGR